MKNNKAIVLLVIETYVANSSRCHLSKIWSMGLKHREWYKDYCDKYMGQHLTGRSEVLRNLTYVCPGIFEQYNRLILERLALGDSLAIAYKCLREDKENNK